MIEAFLQGLVVTVPLTLLSLFFGLLLAIGFVYLNEIGNVYLKMCLKAVIHFIRGVPLLVQIFLIYYGAPQFTWVQESIFWPLLQQPFVCALIALSINSGAYTSVLLQGGVDAIPKGEREACEVLNLSFAAKMRHVILKRALISAWPSYSNEGIIILKSTALASTITLMDLIGVMRQVISDTYQPMPALLMAGAIYLVLSGLLLLLIKKIGKTWIYAN